MSEQNIAQMIEDIIADGKLSNEEKKRLDALIIADGKLSVEERQHLDKLLLLIASGQLIVESS